MRYISLIFLFVVSSFALSLDEAKHLLNRTSFGYSKTDLEKFQKFTKNEAVEYLIQQAKSTKIKSVPKNIKEVSTFDGEFKKLTRDKQKVLIKNANSKTQEIKAWWYSMIFDSQYSFRERMTLFWHNHFVSEYKVVKSPFMMFEQNMLYRKNALGKFDELLHKSTTDMAMLVYLDSNSNKKSHPNENYARELLELFTLGEGNYTEKDIKEAARAFTGYRVNRKKASFRVVKKHHDYGQKEFMGNSGSFFGEDIVNIVLKQEQTARFITMKLYKEFINEKYNRGEVERLANTFRNSGYDISILMKNLLLSKDFWGKENRSNMIKSPVELIASLVKNLEIRVNERAYKFIIKTARNLGQDLFNPPSVKGWSGGRSWIDSTSLVNRSELIKLVVKRRMNNRIIRKLDINDYDDFQSFFYSINTNENILFKNKKSDYQALLSKPIYNLK